MVANLSPADRSEYPVRIERQPFRGSRSLATSAIADRWSWHRGGSQHGEALFFDEKISDRNMRMSLHDDGGRPGAVVDVAV
jgi:hypothetical protein